MAAHAQRISRPTVTCLDLDGSEAKAWESNDPQWRVYDLPLKASLIRESLSAAMALLSSENNLLVVGSRNLNPADQTMDTGEVRSMQIIDAKLRISPIPFFDNWADFSSIAQHPDDPFRLYLANPSEIFEFDLRGQRYELLDIPGLDDIHEVAILNGGLWISNTADDEIVLFDTGSRHVAERIDLRAITRKAGANNQIADTFHVNQVFEAYNGDLCALVHHHSGHQEVSLVAEKVIKRQGDGGVINVTRRTTHNLGLKAPHSVRLVDSSYWVYDSGRFEIKIFNKQWNLTRTLATRGFGRGADSVAGQDIFYAGISATRKRYLGLIPRGEAVPNMVQVFDTKTFAELGTIHVPNIEQVNNVYCLRAEIAEALKNFS
jgi:hypothetical protein